MKRLLIVHYAGDFREAWRRVKTDGNEVYYGHRYILDEMARLARIHGEVGYLSCTAPRYRQDIGGGVTVMGAGLGPRESLSRAIAMIADFAPTHLIVHGPIPAIIRWGIAQHMPVGCIFADSFATSRLYRWLRVGRIERLLADPGISLIANHGRNAALGLVDLGVPAARVLAWDFPHRRTPDMLPAKRAARSPHYQLIYVGSLERKKGLGDLLRAVALLRKNLDVSLTVAGAGQSQRFARLAEGLGIAEHVNFKGLVPNNAIVPLMHSVDVVVVPSHHAFPEGLPLTLYEALASRTPVVASDHPMFAGHLVDGQSAAIFPAGQPQALAATIARVLQEPDLYARLSAGSPDAWQRMQIPLKWGEMIDHWLADGPKDRHWLASHAIGVAL
jgi:glycosyltransferase involved in cell wall biosynthesis